MPELPDTQVGPMISAGQRDTVEGYIATGVAEGARIVTGGDRPGGDLESGFFLRPAVLEDVTNQMTVAREEIFGPVVERDPVRRRGARRSRSPTTRPTACPDRCGRATEPASCGWHGRCAPACWA